MELLSILVNAIFGLSPALIIRFVILRRPLEKRAAKFAAVIIGTIDGLLVIAAASALEIKPNMAPVVLWGLISYAILRIEKSGWKYHEAPPDSSIHID